MVISSILSVAYGIGALYHAGFAQRNAAAKYRANVIDKQRAEGYSVEEFSVNDERRSVTNDAH